MHYFSFITDLSRITKNRSFESVLKFISLICIDDDYILKTDHYEYDTKNSLLTFILGPSNEHIMVKLVGRYDVEYQSHILDQTCDEYHELNELINDVKKYQTLIK